MSRAAGIIRSVAVAVVAVGAAVGATHVSGSLQLAAPGDRAGLPETSSVLVDDSTLVCPGQQRLGAVGLRDVEADVTVAASAPDPGVVAGAPSGGAITLLSGSDASGLGQGGAAGSAVTATVKTADSVLARATRGLAPGLVATQVWKHTGDDDRGLAVTPCQLPSSDVWLVGGGAGPSRTERVILGNPGANAVTASLEVFGARGRVAGLDDRTISVEPHSRAVVSLDALAPDLASPAVHVTATGGVLSAVLDEQWIDGATARGIDDATRAAPPGTDLVVPGIDASGSVWARVANPGDTEALVRLSLLTDAGPVQPDELRAVRVPAGSTLDVPIQRASGAFGLGVRSDQPVVAGAWTERRASTGDRMGDFAWTAATPRLTGLGGVLLPGLTGTTKRLLLTSGQTTARAQVRTGTGDAARTTTVDVPAGSTVATDLGDADSVWVVPTSGEVRGAVSVAGTDGGVPTFSIAAVQSAPVRALSVPVRQVRN
jgi:hypothetical protein